MVILHGSVMNTTINTVTAVGQTTKGLENIPIILQATQGNETIFCTLVAAVLVDLIRREREVELA